jgi:hypothetical protein
VQNKSKLVLELVFDQAKKKAWESQALGCKQVNILADHD